ncbi:hypothetical protein [Novosphingobium sp.]|uniref:hypothetical protein n=1 Tax=Novosphingobium sp. TaxID=1874826 RepID=UPI002611BC28|nr:hypothetical protein [Novosphingobium sp.]
MMQLASNRTCLVTVITVLALWVFAVVPARAAESEESICLPVGRLWNGTAEEIRSIETTPVPDSYRNGAQSCGGPLWAGDLMRWHQRFGTEDTAWRAFEFILRRDGYLLEEARAAPGAIRQAMKRASLAMARGANAKDRDEANRRILAQLDTALQRAINQLGAPVEFSLQALGAAETFRSQRFRTLATQWLEGSEAYRAEIAALATGPANDSPAAKGPSAVLARVLRDARLDRRVDSARLQIALFDAAQSREPDAIARVDALVHKLRTPALDRIEDFAFGAGEDFCDLPDYAEEAVKTACADDYSFEREAKSYLLMKAAAALLHGYDMPTEEFLRLYERDAKNRDPWETRWLGVDPRILSLKEAQAEILLRKAGLNADGEIAPKAHTYEIQEGLEKLVEVTRMFSPADDIVRFRRIATRALEVDSRVRAYNRADGMTLVLTLDRAMAYFRVVLPHLGEIAGGIEPGAPQQ